MARILEGKKFLWDGEEYPGEEDARAIEKEYRANGFEVRVLCENGKTLVYTRRPVSSSEGSD